MVRQGPRPRRIRPAFHGGVSRSSRFSDFLSCDRVVDVGGLKDVSVLASFVWPSGRQPESNGILQASPQMLKVIADTLSLSTAAALGGSASSVGDVSMSCIPFLAPGYGMEDDARNAESADGLTVRARTLQRGLAGTCMAQALLATCQFALNDGISGFIGCGIGALGMQAASPSGYRFLPSYIVLAFCNGTMQVMVGSELAASHHLLAHAAAAGLKLASVVSVVSPGIMFLGMVVAWHLHCELRAIALQALPPSMRNNLMGLPPPVDGVVSGAADGPIGTGADVSGPFRAFAGQSHRLPKGEDLPQEAK